MKLVALSGVRHAAAEVGVYLRREHPPDADRARIRVVDVERNHCLAGRDRGAHLLRVKSLVLRHDLHRVRHNALPGRIQLRHLLSSAGITLFRFSGLISATAPHARQHPVTRIFYQKILNRSQLITQFKGPSALPQKQDTHIWPTLRSLSK